MYKQKMIQTMRMIAMTIVFLNHFFLRTVDSSIIYFGGGFGVAIFFVLSGYLLVNTSNIDERNVKQWASTFWKKKIIRIVPLYWGVTFGVTSIILFKPNIMDNESVTISNFLKSLLFIPYKTNGSQIPIPIVNVGWTLVVEVFVYLLFWIAAIMVKSNRKASLMVSVFLLTGIFINIMFSPNIGGLTFYFQPYMIYFVGGFLIAELEEKQQRNKRFSLELDKFKNVFIITLLIMFIFWSTVYDGKIISIVTLIIVMYVIIVYLKNFNAPKWAVFLGDISYSFYLIHYYIFRFIHRFFFARFDNNWGIIIIELILIYALTILSSYMSWLIVEQKFTSMMKKLFFK